MSFREALWRFIHCLLKVFYIWLWVLGKNYKVPKTLYNNIQVWNSIYHIRLGHSRPRNIYIYIYSLHLFVQELIPNISLNILQAIQLHTIRMIYKHFLLSCVCMSRNNLLLITKKCFSSFNHNCILFTGITCNLVFIWWHESIISSSKFDCIVS